MVATAESGSQRAPVDRLLLPAHLARGLDTEEALHPDPLLGRWQPLKVRRGPGPPNFAPVVLLGVLLMEVRPHCGEIGVDAIFEGCGSSGGEE